MNSVIMITQFFFTLVIGMYFFTKLRNEKSDSETLANNSKKEAEHLNCMRHIHLSEPVTETARPKNVNEIIGQDDGIRAIKAALCGPDPQHILIYGPAGVGKTAAARVALECAKKSNGTPFSKCDMMKEALPIHLSARYMIRYIKVQVHTALQVYRRLKRERCQRLTAEFCL